MISASFTKFEFDGVQDLSASFIGIQTSVLPNHGFFGGVTALLHYLAKLFAS